MMGPPIDNRKYNVYESDNIKVYLDAGIRIKKDKFRIRLNKFLWMKEIRAEGIVMMK